MASLLEQFERNASVQLGVRIQGLPTFGRHVVRQLCDHVEKVVADLSERIDGLARVRSEQDARLSKRIDRLERAAESPGNPTEPAFVPREYVKRADVVGLDCDGVALCIGDAVVEGPAWLSALHRSTWLVQRRACAYGRRVDVKSHANCVELCVLTTELKLKAP